MQFATRGVQSARAFYVSHKRTVLLGVAVAIAATLAVRLAGVRAPFLQRSELGGQAVNTAKIDTPKGKPSEGAGAVKPGGEGDVTKSHLLWKHPTRHTDHIVSPLVKDGRIFLIKEGGINTVFETATGQSLRAARRLGNSGGYFASPVGGDGKIYLASDTGIVIVLKSSDRYEVLAENDLGESIRATPALVDGTIYVRTNRHLYAFGAGDVK